MEITRGFNALNCSGTTFTEVLTVVESGGGGGIKFLQFSKIGSRLY